MYRCPGRKVRCVLIQGGVRGFNHPSLVRFFLFFLFARLFVRENERSFIRRYRPPPLPGSATFFRTGAGSRPVTNCKTPPLKKKNPVYATTYYSYIKDFILIADILHPSCTYSRMPSTSLFCDIIQLHFGTCSLALCWVL